MPDTNHVTGNDVREVRRILGLSQDAAAVTLDVAPRTLVNWEGTNDTPLPTRARPRFAVAATSALIRQVALERASDGLLERLASELSDRQDAPVEGPLFSAVVNETVRRENRDGHPTGEYDPDTLWRAERLALLPDFSAAVGLVERLEDKTGSRTIHRLVGALLGAISEAQLFTAVSTHDGRQAEPFVAAIGRLQSVADRATTARRPSPLQAITFGLQPYDLSNSPADVADNEA